MKVKFIKDYENSQLLFHEGDVVTPSEQVSIIDLNEELIMFVVKGLRYDIPKECITIIEDE